MEHTLTEIETIENSEVNDVVALKKQNTPNIDYIRGDLKICNNGLLNITVDPAILKYLKPTSALMLYLFKELYKVAVSNHRVHYQSFIFSNKKIAEYLNLTLVEVCEVLKDLEKWQLIKIFNSRIKGYMGIYINFPKIDELLHNTNKQTYQDIQYYTNPINEKVNYCKSTMWIKQYIEKHSDQLNPIPLIYYSIIDAIVRGYEKNGHNILHDFQVLEALDDFVIFYKKSDDYRIKFTLFIYWLPEIVKKNDR